MCNSHMHTLHSHPLNRFIYIPIPWWKRWLLWRKLSRRWMREIAEWKLPLSAYLQSLKHNLAAAQVPGKSYEQWHSKGTISYCYINPSLIMITLPSIDCVANWANYDIMNPYNIILPTCMHHVTWFAYYAMCFSVCLCVYSLWMIARLLLHRLCY